jgi:hypothetical protein
MTDCRECKFSMIMRGQLMCLAHSFLKPVEYMRDARSMCGLEGALFESKEYRKPKDGEQ